MRWETVAPGETPAAFAARTGAPLCAVLRANRLLHSAWLLPGRRARVPEGRFCVDDAFPCPASLFHAPAREEPLRAFTVEEGDDVYSLARALGTSERLLWLALGRRGGAPREGERFCLSALAIDRPVGTCLPGESLDAFCARYGVLPEPTRAINQLSGDLLPGMRVVLPR